MSALFGIAWGEQLLPNMLAPISQFLPASYFANDPDGRKGKITLFNLLTMTAGFKWDEGDIKTKMPYYMADDGIKWLLDQPLSDTPGTKFNYTSPLTELGTKILADKAGMDIADYADQKLFKPLGIKAVRWDSVPSGYKSGGGGLFLTPRDMARFGYLYLNHGKVDGKQIVPQAWVDGLTKAIYPVGYVPNRYYGAWWWVQKFGGYDAYFALGWGGQYIVNVPALNLIVVGTSIADVTSTQDGVQDTFFFSILEKNILPAIAP
ncbi:MAG: serine hydrolase [Bdellovibrionia bacterium]